MENLSCVSQNLILSRSVKDLSIKAAEKCFPGTHPRLETGWPAIGSGCSHLAPPPLCPFVAESDGWGRTVGHGGSVPGGRTVSGQWGAASGSNLVLLVLDGRLERYDGTQSEYQHSQRVLMKAAELWAHFLTIQELALVIQEHLNVSHPDLLDVNVGSLQGEMLRRAATRQDKLTRVVIHALLQAQVGHLPGTKF